MESNQHRPQVSVEIGGIITLLRPQTPQGLSWLKDELNVTGPQGAGGTFVVEPRRVPELLAAMNRSGLVVELGGAPTEEEVLGDALARLSDEASGDWSKFDYAAAKFLDRARFHVHRQRHQGDS